MSASAMPTSEVVELALGEILEVDAFQVRKHLIPRQVVMLKDLILAGVELDPIEVARITDRPDLIGPAVYHGFHRLRAARELGLETIHAIVTPMTYKEALWNAATANMRNGEPLRRDDYVNVFKAYVNTDRHRDGAGFKTYETIQREIGAPCTWYTIRNWMQRWFANIFRAMGRGEDRRSHGDLRDGKRRPFGTEVDGTPRDKAIDHFRQGFHNAMLLRPGEWSGLRKMLDAGFQWYDRAREYHPEDRPPPPEWIASPRGTYADPSAPPVGIGQGRVERMSRTLGDMFRASRFHTPEERAKVAAVLTRLAAQWSDQGES